MIVQWCSLTCHQWAVKETCFCLLTFGLICIPQQSTTMDFWGMQCSSRHSWCRCRWYKPRPLRRLDYFKMVTVWLCVVTWWGGPGGIEAWSLELLLPSVLWHCWLGHLTRKNPPLIWPIMCSVGRYTLLNQSVCLFHTRVVIKETIWRHLSMHCEYGPLNVIHGAKIGVYSLHRLCHY